MPLTIQQRGQGLAGNCFSPQHDKGSARDRGFPGTRGPALLVRDPSEWFPSALINTLTHALEEGLAQERQTAAPSKM